MSTVFFPLPTLVATVGDPGRTRIVMGTVVVLIVIGIGLACAAVWLLRSTRTDPEVLAPLELLGERRWQRSAPDVQQRRLDESRLSGATPLGRPAPREGVDLDDELHDVQEQAPVEVGVGDVDARLGSSDQASDRGESEVEVDDDAKDGVDSEVEVKSEFEDESGVASDTAVAAECYEPTDAEPVVDVAVTDTEPDAETDTDADAAAEPDAEDVAESRAEDDDEAPVDAANTRSN